jgi:hypothetical protein
LQGARYEFLFTICCKSARTVKAVDEVEVDRSIRRMPLGRSRCRGAVLQSVEETQRTKGRARLKYLFHLGPIVNSALAESLVNAELRRLESLYWI